MSERHGMRNTVEYRIWAGIKSRCLNPNDTAYHRYGGVGITMCKKWVNSFSAFFADVGYRPDGMDSLDRINNTKGYTPKNVRWATKKQQANNRKTNKLITYKGKTMTMAGWAEELGISYETIQWRVRNNREVFAPLNRSYSRVKRK